MRPQDEQNGKPGDLSGALEMVNKAIEEVRSEVEREKKKLSRIGDETYDPSETKKLPSSSAVKRKSQPSHLAYDPGSYQMTSESYNPTPGCSKYTLDADTQGSNSNSMEYVPTSVKKPPSQAYAQLPSPPPSPKYSTSPSSSRSKYTVDNWKPSTDMEYDPLSNYAAGIAAKSKRVKAAEGLRGGLNSRKVPGSDMSDEEYVVAAKKPRKQSVDFKKYTVSESDGESSGTEYRPTSLSNLQQRKGHSGSLWDAVMKEKKERIDITLNALMQRNKEDSAGDSDVLDFPKGKDSPEKKKVARQSGQDKSFKSKTLHRLEMEASKTNRTKSGSSRERDSKNNSNLHSAKKENKSRGKGDEGKDAMKVKTADKVQREGRDERRRDHKIKAGEKVKTDSGGRDKDTENARDRKKPKMSDSAKEGGKSKDRHGKNGKLDIGKRAKDEKKSSKSGGVSSGAADKCASANSKGKVKQSVGSSNGKRLEDKRQSLSFSHVDLFGDESPDEARPMTDDDDEEPEEVLVRKSADALKRGRLHKRKASDETPSSSDDEGGGAAKDDWTGVGINVSGFQEDLDFDSDPMEECLRIFNESKDVKREDKGRQAKSVLVFPLSHAPDSQILSVCEFC